MRKSLLLTLILIFAAGSVMAQNLRFERPLGNNVALNGSFLFGETSSSSGVTQTGVEFVTDGDTIFAAHDGTAGLVEESGDYNRSIILDGMWGEDKISTLYGFLGEVFISSGDEVSAGDPIAVSGGASDPYTFFEIRHGWHSGEEAVEGGKLNPEGWFALDGTGVIIGNIPGATNSTRVDIDPDPKPRPPYSSYSYSLTYDFGEAAIGSDPIYEENYIIGDVQPGEYTVTAMDGSYSKTVTVVANEAVHADGGVVSVEEPSEIANAIQLDQNYPNPFNPTTVISYTIPENSHVNLAVYDIMGKKVAQLANSRMAAGSYDINFNASDLSSGIYFYRLNVDNNVFTRKMTLIK